MVDYKDVIVKKRDKSEIPVRVPVLEDIDTLGADLCEVFGDSTLSVVNAMIERRARCSVLAGGNGNPKEPRITAKQIKNLLAQKDNPELLAQIRKALGLEV